METPHTNPNQDPDAELKNKLVRPLTAVANVRNGIWREVRQGRNSVREMVSEWPGLREQLETKTQPAFEQWSADLKKVGRPIKTRFWKRAYRRLARRQIFNQLNWRVLIIRAETALMWVVHILKLTVLFLLWLGVPALLLYGGWRLLVFLWSVIFGGPVAIDGGAP